MNYEVDTIMMNKVEKVASKLETGILFIEVQTRKSDNVMFYHIALIGKMGPMFVLGINYKKQYAFFTSKKTELNNMVDLVKIKDDILYLVCDKEHEITKLKY